MEEVPFNPLLIVTPEEKNAIRKEYGMEDVTKLREYIEILQKWCQTQDHLLNKDIENGLMERLILQSRGSLEGTKRKIDRISTMRGITSELVLNRVPREFDRFMKHVYYVALPKLSTNQTRVSIMHFPTTEQDEFSSLALFRLMYYIGEYRLCHDYCLGDRYIIDLQNIRLPFIGKLNPLIMKKAEILGSEGYGTRIKGIHILNAPGFIDKLMFILKQALRAKVASRLHVHSTYEDLHKHVSKDILPTEYGGNERSMKVLVDEWREELSSKTGQDSLRQMEKMITDETRRSKEQSDQEYLGIPGSFRTLTVD